MSPQRALPRPIWGTLAWVTLAMLAFAGNSVLCRLALTQTSIDPASFTSVRLISGALVLGCLLGLRATKPSQKTLGGDWPSAFALWAYAAGFSFAYLTLSAATGALLLFAAVQITMIGASLHAGVRYSAAQIVGLLLTLSGLFGLLAPGLTAPPWFGSALMISAGIAWGVYSLRGRAAGDSIHTTAGNFARAVPLTLLLSAATISRLSADSSGLLYAFASGALTSGCGYAIWYHVLPRLSVSTAAITQLSVPLITAVGGALWLGEAPTLRLWLAGAAILGGIVLVIGKGSLKR